MTNRTFQIIATSVAGLYIFLLLNLTTPIKPIILFLVLLPVGARVFFIILLPEIKKKLNSDVPKSEKNKEIKFIFDQLLQHLDTGVMILNYNGNVEHVNALFKKMIDEGLEDTIKTKLILISKLYQAINQAIATEVDGDVTWDFKQSTYRSKITTLKFEDIFYGLIVTAVDITKLEQIERVQSDFLADISHEIKTPLAAILGASEILNQTKRKLTSEERNDFQDVLVKESKRLNRLILELTDLSKLNSNGFQSLVKSQVSLVELLEEVGKTMKYQLEEKNLNYTLNIPPNTYVFVDYDKFFQIILNLLSNAIRYTSKGGISITSHRNKNFTVIEFKDTGFGIGPQQLARIFDRFYRSDEGRTRDQGGSGLGLAITRAIIEAHKGSIIAKSEIHTGTTFTITLPTIN